MAGVWHSHEADCRLDGQLGLTGACLLGPQHQLQRRTSGPNRRKTPALTPILL